MLKLLASIIAIAIGMVATSAAAQTRLPDVLQNAAEARSGVFEGRENSPWLLEQYGDIPGKGCVLYYVTKKEMMMVVGPDAKGIVTEDPNEAAVILSGPSIPLAPGGEIKYQVVTITIDGMPVRTIKALLVPNMTGDKTAGGLLLYARSLEEALMMVRDTQTLGIQIDGKPVYSIKWSGAVAQASKLRRCAAGNPV